MERKNIGDAKDYAKGCFLTIIKFIHYPLEIEIDAMMTDDHWCDEQKLRYESILNVDKYVRYVKYSYKDESYFNEYKSYQNRVIFFDPNVGLEPDSSCNEGHFKKDNIEKVERSIIIIFQDMSQENADWTKHHNNVELDNFNYAYYIDLSQIGFWVFQKDCIDKYMEYNKFFPGRVTRLKK